MLYQSQTGGGKVFFAHGSVNPLQVVLEYVGVDGGVLQLLF
jgi:hypothetical protein